MHAVTAAELFGGELERSTVVDAVNGCDLTEDGLPMMIMPSIVICSLLICPSVLLNCF